MSLSSLSQAPPRALARFAAPRLAALRSQLHAIHPWDHAAWTRFIGAALLVSVLATGVTTRTWASVGIASAAQAARPATPAATPAVRLAVALAPKAAVPAPLQGADIDGDGHGDFANPTGHAARGHDAYGFGGFGSSRDAGERRHEGVDFVSRPGQVVVAPMSGYVARIGYAYADDASLRVIEIVNPALNYVARVLYVTPTVAVGQTIAVGAPLGKAQDLRRRYPGGMTNHVHLQLARQGGPWINAARLIAVGQG